MNFLVRAPIGPNDLYQWIPCDTIQEAVQVARIVFHGEAPIVYNLNTGEKMVVKS